MKAISIPFRFTSDTKAVASTTDINKIIEQQIVDLLTTLPGEKLMNPRYGTTLKNLLFEEMDPLVFAEYRMEAMNELNTLLPFGRVMDLQISVPSETFYADPDDTTITVSVKYAVPPFDVSVVTFNINPTTTMGDSYYA